MSFGHEIDFLPVGTGGKSGDAIALRFGELFGDRQHQTVALIDGGFRETADEVVGHIRQFYATSTLDLVVSTHPDADHINGLLPVMQELDVRELWMHLPSTRRADFDRAIRALGQHPYADQLRASLDAARELESLANQLRVPVREPFARLVHSSGVFSVVGPTENFYKSVLADATAPDVPRNSLLRFLSAAGEVVSRALESLDVETLTDSGQTSPINNTCALTMLNAGGKLQLFTADAGIPALHSAMDYLQALGYNPSMLEFVQIPHHGSRRNVGPTVLDRLLGRRGGVNAPAPTAVVSAAPEGAPKHPSRRVTNAFRRRGAKVHATQGSKKWYNKNAPARGWRDSVEIPFYHEVED